MQKLDCKFTRKHTGQKLDFAQERDQMLDSAS